MKNYIYTARNDSGSIIKGNLKAAERTAALEQIRSSGLVPISVEEGSLKTAPGVGHKMNDKTIGLLAGVLTIAVGVFFALQIFIKKENDPKPSVEFKPKVNTVAQAVPTNNGAAASDGLAVSPTEQLKVQDRGVSAPQGDLKGVVPPEIKKTSLIRPKARVLVPGMRNADTNAPNPYATFRTRSERMMSQMLEAQPGEIMVDIGFGADLNQDFIAALDNTIEIYPTDTEEMAAHKKDVAWLKEEMRRLVATGQSPEEILTTLREQHNEIAAYRSELARQLSALKKEGTPEEIEQFVEEANKLLEPYGTRPLIYFPALNNRRPEK